MTTQWNFSISFVLVLFIGSLNTACHRSQDVSQLKIQLPSHNLNPSLNKTVTSLATTWGYSDPTAIAEMACYLVAIESTESPTTGHSCTDTGGLPLMQPDFIFGAFAAGTNLELEVPSGIASKISLIGFAAADIAACAQFNPANGAPKSQVSAPFVVGATSVDLLPGPMEIEIAVAIDATKKIDTCLHPLFQPETTVPVTQPGDGTPAILQLSNASYDFGANAISTPVIFEFSLSLGGSTPATNITVSSFTDAAFSFPTTSIFPGGGTCTDSLSSGSCTFKIEFQSATPNTYTDTIAISYYDGTTTQTQNLSLTGTISSPTVGLLSLSVTNPFDMGNISTTGISSNLLTITNSGGQTVTGMIATPTLTTPFLYEGGSYPGTAATCGSTLAANDTCTIKVQFSPSGIGMASQNITIDYDNGTSPVTLTHGLEGTGFTPAILAISEVPDAANYGNLEQFESLLHQFTVTNSGVLAATNISGIFTSGADFSFVGGSYPGLGGTCGDPIVVGTPCTIALAYTANTIGTSNDILSLNYTDGGGPAAATIPIDGNGVAPVVKQLATAYNHNCAVLPNNDLKCWGSNTNGQLGYENTTNLGDTSGDMGASLAPVNVGTSRSVKFVSVGSNATCAILDDDSLKCWGNNGSSQLATGATTPIGDGAGEMGDSLAVIDPGVSFKHVSVGGNHVCAITLGDAVKCWGNNGKGSLGDGTLTTKSTPTLIDSGVSYAFIKAAGNQTCGITTAGILKCWGENTLGQIGDATMVDKSLPTVIDAGTNYLKVGLSGQHTCGITSTNNLKCWGSNTNGQLGKGDTNGSTSPVPPISINGMVKSLSVSGMHTCAVDDNGLKCWGGGGSGQTGQGGFPATLSTPTSVLSVNFGVHSVHTGGTHTCARYYDATIKCWGANSASQLGIELANGTFGASTGEMATLPLVLLE